MQKFTLTIVAFLGLIAGAMAQATATHQVDITINSVAMIRAVHVNGSTPENQNFTVEAPTIAGGMPTNRETPNSGLYLQYTSIKTATGTPRTIKAALTTGTIPAGLAISATAFTPTGGTGDVGTSNSEQTISAIAATMIKNIGSGYTGIATASGAEVRYSSTITTMASLKATASTPLTVTYTLSSE
jgi:hypothetical protein